MIELDPMLELAPLSPSDVSARLTAVGLGEAELARWRAASPRFIGVEGGSTVGLDQVTASMATFFALGADLRERLPHKPARTGAEQSAVTALDRCLRRQRHHFLAAYGEQVYRRLTGNFQRSRRVEDLVADAALLFPGLVPARTALDQEQGRPLAAQDGLAIDQGLFVSWMLARPTSGRHLVHAMLRPTQTAYDLLPRFQAAGAIDLDVVSVSRRGSAGYVSMQNRDYLNAEDNATVAALETAIDLVLLDPAIRIGVLRGGPVPHPTYSGRRVFSSGLNLTHLYEGKLAYVECFLRRELGPVNKLYRGLTGPDYCPDEPEATLEKPWLAVVDSFAIGGGCQLLLVMDWVLAEAGAYLSLPAKTEGIVPGTANLRLGRLVGPRLARDLIATGREIATVSAEGRLLCDEVAPTDQLDGTISRVVAEMAAGSASFSANRKALRAGQEPLDAFRDYMALYAREQAVCLHDPALVRNLETRWVNRPRQPQRPSRARPATPVAGQATDPA